MPGSIVVPREPESLVWAPQPLVSSVGLKGDVNVLEGDVGSSDKTDKSYQKYHRGEKYEVLATSGCLGNRE